MTPIEDIARELEPGAASASPAPGMGARPPQPRRGGHWAKIHQAVSALRREGRLPETLRRVERNERVRIWLHARGFNRWELPFRSALDRYFKT